MIKFYLKNYYITNGVCLCDKNVTENITENNLNSN